MKFSVIVPTYNDEKVIEKCLQAIKKSDYKEYELIVVDDGSSDDTLCMAQKYADRVVSLSLNQGRSIARNQGALVASGEILLNIDSDVVIYRDTLEKIHNYFRKYPELDAITGLLSKEHPNKDYFSQYKNLYMHYIFFKQPDRVTFLYGSLHAVRRSAFKTYGRDVEIADDTAIGQELAQEGKKIGFYRDLEVIHLKKHSMLSFFRNDFQIPFDWSKLFIKYQGWKQLGEGKGYAHSPKEQLLSIALVPFVFLSLTVLIFMDPFFPLWFVLLLTPFFLWYALNHKFVSFLAKEKGFFFAFISVGVTLMDHFVMGVGIFLGLLVHGVFSK